MAEVTRTRIGVITHLFPDGPLHEASAIEALRNAVRACLDARELQVVVDLSDVTLVASEALEALLDAQDELVRIGGRLRLAHANRTLEDVLRITGMSDRIELMASESGDDTASAPVPVPPEGRRIGEILVERGLVTEDQIERALKVQSETGIRMAEVMVEEGWLAEWDLLDALSEQLSLPLIKLRAGLYDPHTVRLLDPQVAKRLSVLPLFRVRDVLFLATADP